MPPKKKVAASEGAEAEGGAFRWTLENERKLLVLTQGRYLTGEDYERLVSVFPGTNLNGVKIKVSRFRVEQRKLYDELGWVLPEGGAKTKTPATPSKKRTAAATSNGDDGIAASESPTKKPRAKKLKKEPVKKEADDGSGGSIEDVGEEGAGVKQELLDDEI